MTPWCEPTHAGAVHVATGPTRTACSLPVGGRPRATTALDISALLKETGFVTLDPASSTPPRASRRSPTSTATRDPALPRLPDRAARREVHLPRGQLPADLRRAADRRASWTTFTDQIQRHTLLHEDLKRFFDGFPRDAHPMPVLSSAVSGAVDLLPGQPRPVRRRAGRALDRPAAGQAADDRGLRVQEVDRPAVPLPGQLARPGRELPADDVRRPGRAVRGRPGASPRRWTCCSSCTPTTSRTARPRRCGWSARRQANLFASVSAGINALFGPAARRRQPGGAGDAARASSDSGGDVDDVRRARSRTRRTASG